MSQDKQDKVLMGFHLPREVAKRLKVAAAEQGITNSALVVRALRRELGMAHECKICSENGIETAATRYALGMYLCDECAREYENYLRPGERLEDMTKEEMDRRIYS